MLKTNINFRKNYFRRIFIVFCLIELIASNKMVFANEPDSAYIFAYATTKNAGHNGLHFAWSIDKENWHPIGPEYSYVKCDYGQWGAEKRMVNPYLFQTSDGLWHCIWNLNDKNENFAYVESKDLVYWMRQSYYTDIKDFKFLNPNVLTSERNKRKDVVVSGKTETGSINKVSWNVIDGLIKAQQLSAYRQQLYSENTKADSERFASLKPVDVTITPDISKSKKISDLLIGIFFEDINYAADGGLYAELVQNRDFEYTPDENRRDPAWNNTKAWSLSNADKGSFTVDSVSPIHPNNMHYAVLQVNEIGLGLMNEGFDGIPLKAGEKYDFSVFARVADGKSEKLTIRLLDENNAVCGEISTQSIGKEWKKYDAVLIAKSTVSKAKLEIIPQLSGKIDLDMISLFPQKTFKGRKNGLREDLAQVIADIHPRFVRFPGGCVAHGDGLENMYRWKNTIGPLESRKSQGNIWRYHQSMGLGYYEYFQFCEDIGAEPLPVLPAGVPCQNSGQHNHALGGQQGGIPMDEMQDYVQEVLDLIEWANGDAKSEWGKKRAEAGHPKPFNLKYIGIGNEDLISDVFEERFTMIFNAVKAKYPEIIVIGTVGPFSEGTDYVEGWDIATKLKVPMVDEHYYQPPGWFIYNQDYYDRYDRSKSKVYLGEYAAHLPGKANNLETALAEALFLTSVERNGDVVTMSSYAPLLAKDGYTRWNPDLIYFNNTEIRPTVGYYVQQLYGQNSGGEYIASEINISNDKENVKNRIAVSMVRDTKTNDLILKMVNLLPVNVNSTIDLKDFQILDTKAEKTVLTGNPNDKKAKPVVSSCIVDKTFTSELPPYSFTVIRIKIGVGADPRVRPVSR